MFLKILITLYLFTNTSNYRIKILGCQRSIIETYKLTSNLVGTRSEFFLCPKIRSNCCSIFDQFSMYTTWRDKIKPKLKAYQKGFLKKLLILNKMVKFIEAMKIDKMLMKLRISMQKKEFLVMRYKITKSKRLSSLIFAKIVRQKKLDQFMLDTRSSFFCNICDYQNHPFFDLKRKVISIGLGTCANIVENTIEQSYTSNIFLARYLMEYSKILNSFSNDDFEKPVILDDYKMLRTNIGMCFKAFKAGLVSIKPCKKYCNYYNFNNHSPFIEGNHNFINDLLNSFARFIKENLNKRKHKKLKLDSIPRFLSASSNPDYNLLRLTKGKSPKDNYHEEYQDPELSDYVVNKMFNFQEYMQKDLQYNFVNFIKNRLHYFDSDVDFANPTDESGIFNISTMEATNLANFSTLASNAGADFEKNFKNNINEPIRELIFHIKDKSRFRITFEELDPKLLLQVNDITNKNVKDFHQDNFIDFKNFLRDSVKDKIMGNYDFETKEANKRDYNINK